MINTDSKRPATVLFSFLGVGKTTVSSHALNNCEDQRFPFITQGLDKNQGFKTLDSSLPNGAKA